MHQLQKDLLLIDPNDSSTVQELKEACNQMIVVYNQLDNPFEEVGQELLMAIDARVMKIYQLKDLHYYTPRS